MFLNINFRRGCKADEPSISGFFKLQKIRTVENLIFKNIIFYSPLRSPL